MSTQQWPEFLSKISVLDRYCDLTIECGGQTFKVNSAIIGAQSPVIDRAISQTGGFEESKTKVFRITDSDVDSVKRMIQYLHTGDYSVSSISAAPSDEEKERSDQSEQTSLDAEAEVPSRLAALSSHVNVYQLADFLQIPELNEITAEKIETILSEHWSAEAFFHTAEALPSTLECQTLHSALGSVAADHLPELLRDKRFHSLDFGRGFTIRALQVCNLEITQAEADMNEFDLKMTEFMERLRPGFDQYKLRRGAIGGHRFRPRR